jgi:hypothetical protein
MGLLLNTKLYELKAIEKDDLVAAIFDLETKKWRKANEDKLKADPAFSEAMPQRDDVIKRFEGMSAEETLARYATKRDSTPNRLEVLSADEAKAVGALLLQLEKNNEKLHKIHPTIMAGQHALEPKELSAWLQANANAKFNIDVVKWKTDNNVGLTGEPSFARNGTEELLIETRNGQRRVVGNGNLSEKIDGYYGGVKGVTVGDGDLLDIYVSNKVYAGLSDKESYKGPIFIMQQMDKGKPDEPKAGYAASAEEFKAVMTSTWDDPKKFEAANQGKYIQVTPEQWEAFKEAVKKNASLTVEEFAKDNAIPMQEFAPAPPKKIGLGIQAGTISGIALASMDEDFWAPKGLPAQQGNLAIKSGGAKLV